MRVTGPARVTDAFIRSVWRDSQLGRKVHVALKQLHLATPAVLRDVVRLLRRLLAGLDDADENDPDSHHPALPYSHLGLIRAVLYGSGNAWFYEPLLGGRHVGDFPMAALLDGVGDEPLLVGLLACVCSSAKTLVRGRTSGEKAQWLASHKAELAQHARDICETTQGAWPPVLKLLQYHKKGRRAPQRCS